MSDALARLDARDNAAYRLALSAGYSREAIATALVLANLYPRIYGCRERAREYRAAGKRRDCNAQLDAIISTRRHITFALAASGCPQQARDCYRFLEARHVQ